MLIRIVRMTFDEKRVEHFLHLFEKSKNRIRHFPGCRKLELLKDTESDTVFMTYSWWEDKHALDNYRNSDFFKNTWEETKTYFKEKPQVFSSYKLTEAFCNIQEDINKPHIFRY